MLVISAHYGLRLVSYTHFQAQGKCTKACTPSTLLVYYKCHENFFACEQQVLTTDCNERLLHLTLVSGRDCGKQAGQTLGEELTEDSLPALIPPWVIA